MPFGPYKNFKDCVSKTMRKKGWKKERASAYCASIERRIRGKSNMGMITTKSEPELIADQPRPKKKRKLTVDVQSGIYITKPHGKFITQGKKKAIVKPINLDRITNRPLYICSGGYVHGIISLSKGRVINLKMFKETVLKHRISEIERKIWWEGKQKFYYHPFRILKIFEEPRKFKWKRGYQSFIKNVEFLDIEHESLEFLMTQAFGSPGGKSRVAKKLISVFPKHKTFIEPFAGGAAVYFTKEPSEVDVLNDLDPEIAHAYHFLKNISKEEIHALTKKDWRPQKNLFEKLRDSKPTNKIDRFYRYYYLMRWSYGKMMTNFGNYDINTKLRIDETKFMRLKERLKNTQVFCKDYKYVLEKFNSPDSFAFIDPPYPTEWPSTLKGTTFSKEQCQEMHDFLKKWKGKFMVTLNVDKWIKDMFSDFNIKKFSITRTLQGKGKIGKQYELAITNYSLDKSILEKKDKKELSEQRISKYGFTIQRMMWLNRYGMKFVKYFMRIKGKRMLSWSFNESPINNDMLPAVYGGAIETKWFKFDGKVPAHSRYNPTNLNANMEMLDYGTVDVEELKIDGKNKIFVFDFDGNKLSGEWNVSQENIKNSKKWTFKKKAINESQPDTKDLRHLQKITLEKSMIETLEKKVTIPYKIRFKAIAVGKFNGVFYSEEELKKALPSMKGVDLTIDHGKSVRDVVGKVVNAWWDEKIKGIMADGIVTDKELAEKIHDKLVTGVSVEVLVDYHRGNMGLAAHNCEFIAVSIVRIAACVDCKIVPN